VITSILRRLNDGEDMEPAEVEGELQPHLA
jgi:hypothetical protein